LSEALTTAAPAQLWYLRAEVLEAFQLGFFVLCIHPISPVTPPYRSVVNEDVLIPQATANNGLHNVPADKAQ
jgi:hypothetical protein